ncbi:MAG: hypothetical protein OXH73_03220 [Caldilineaceae bacterium]|nr:hypothetical protein [Caldilineaceae bacterium]
MAQQSPSGPHGLTSSPQGVMEQFFTQLNNILAFIKDLRQRGIVEWNEDQNYKANARTVGSDGVLYKALQATGPSSTNAQDPTTETADPREVWEREVPAPAAEFKPLAWGQMGSNGSFITSPAPYGVDTANCRRTGTSGDYTYEIRLPGDALGDVCRAIVVPSPNIDGRMTITERNDGINVKLQHGAHTGTARTFYFVVFGVK